MRKPLMTAIALLALAPYVWASDTDVIQKAQRFAETSLTIRVGDTVRFLNNDDVSHNVTILGPDGVPDDEGLQKPGDIITHNFDTAGDYEVRCSIHPRMKMTIAVK
jgi:plastocyanin